MIISYPEIAVTEGQKENMELLEELAGSYLLKDVLSLERIRSSRTLVDLLKLPFHFWHTYDGQEIDYVKERDGRLFGFKCKWSSK